MDDLLARAQMVMARCDELARLSEERGRLTRPYATPSMQQANAAVATWMREAGMEVRRDNVGNVIGRYEAREQGARTLLLGSHLDSVRDAGKYDGPLGVLVALNLVERLHATGTRLPYALEVVAFADEEGLRYHTCYLGSSAMAGAFDRAALGLVDADGVTLAEAMRSFGGDPARLHEDARRADDLLGYCEVHIEQGPVLEQLGLPVGVVSVIMGQSRYSLRFEGQAGHAGTVPMELRHDALCAAAEFTLAVEALARREEGLVATVGQLEVAPGASNVIPGRVSLSIDVRHLDDRAREEAGLSLRQGAARISNARGVAGEWQDVQASGTVQCSPELTGLLAQAVAAVGYEQRAGRGARLLPSGAGHDAVAMANLCPIAMLFVRCKGGVSHSPAESVTVEDVAAAIGVMDSVLERLSEAYLKL